MLYLKPGSYGINDEKRHSTYVQHKVAQWYTHHKSRRSIVVSICACHARDQGSIPCVGDFFFA